MPWLPDDVRAAVGFRQYPNAPINEAIFDLRVTLPEDVSGEYLAALALDEAETYPNRQPQFHNRVQWTAGQPPAQSSIVVGYACRSADDLQVVQTNLEGFTFSRLRPYQDWSTFSTEAFRLWQGYATTVRPRVIKRIALRYINQINLGNTGEARVDLSTYVLTRPEVAPLLPQDMQGYFLNVQLSLRENGPRAQLIETVVEPETDMLGLVLDIDVSWEEDLVFDGDTLEKLRERFAELRDCKNAVFEASITDAARELFA